MSTTIFLKGEGFVNNQDIRTAAKMRGVRLWQIAEALGITDGNFSRRLRRELSETDKERILHIIDNLAQGVTP